MTTPIVDSDRVLVGANTYVSVAPLGSTAPTTGSAALDSAFVSLGGVTVDGLSEAFADDIINIKANGQMGDVLSFRQGHERQMKATFLEFFNADVQGFYLGLGSAPSITSGAIEIDDTVTPDLDFRAVVFDIYRTSTKRVRLYWKRAAITARDDVAYKGSDASGLGCTITAFVDSTGNIGKRWLIDDVFDSSSSSSSSSSSAS